MIGTLPCDWRPHQGKDLRRCRVLWLTVIYNAIQEYRLGYPAAENFLFGSSGDLELICELAGVNAAAVRAAADQRAETTRRLQFVPYSVRHRQQEAVLA